jgi:ATP-dependent Clp protease protease subunit
MIEMIRKEVFTCSEWTFYGDLDEFEQFSDFIKCLHNANDGDQTLIRLNCPGGRCDIGASIISAMLNSKTSITCLVEAPSYSMGAIIALCGDNLIMKDNTFLMFHDYSGGYYGKGGDTAKAVQYQREQLSRDFESWCVPFLTKKEFSAMMSGEDFYIKNDDPTLAARVKRHFK